MWYFHGRIVFDQEKEQNTDTWVNLENLELSKRSQTSEATWLPGIGRQGGQSVMGVGFLWLKKKNVLFTQ